MGRARSFHRWPSFAGGILGGLTATVLLARLGAAVAPLVHQSPLHGLDYLPPWWLAGLVIPVGLLCFWAKRRGLAVVLLALFLALLGVAEDWRWQGGEGTVFAEASSFTVVAFNVRYYRAGRTEVIQGIKSLNPDVVLLSENRLDSAGVKEMRAAFAPYTFVSGRPNETAIASRLPILEAKEVELPSRAPTLNHPNRVDEQVNHPHRSFMHARVDLHGTPVHVIAIRFIAGRPASAALSDQLEWGRYLLSAQREELGFLLDYLSRLKGPIVLGGDLNAPPTAGIIRELATVAADAYLANHWLGLPTYPTKFPMVRLDYLFSMNGVVATEAVRPDLRVSNHYPILARFSVGSS